jgi:prephenate dehydrogenase
MNVVNSPIARSVVVGGRGAVGRLYVNLLCEEGTVTVFDLIAAGGDRHSIQGDACALSAATQLELSEADLAVIALPESAALRALPGVAAQLPKGAAVADTLSVKSAVCPALARAADLHGLEAVSLNPMFAPALGFAGRPVAVVNIASGPVTSRLRWLMEQAGARLVDVDAEVHDVAAASLQAATHAAILGFGQALTILGTPLETLVELAPPPHLALLALLARICSGAPEVYWDVQASNLHAAAARHALAEGITELDRLAGEPVEQFSQHVALLQDWLGPARGELAARAARLMSELR